MKNVVDKCSNKGCSIDIGSLIDNDNCQCCINRTFNSDKEADIYLEEVTKLAETTTSEIDKLSITSEKSKIENQTNIKITLSFPYQAETIIFELAEKRINI